MKTKSYLIGLLCAIALAGLFTVAGQKTIADNSRVQAATIIIGWEVYTAFVNGRNVEAGMRVKWVGRSQNAPTVNVGSDVAEVCAYLQDFGLVMEPPTLRQEFIFNRRPH